MRILINRCLYAFVAVAVLGAAPLHADTYQGKWFRVTGLWDGARLQAERTDWRNAGEDARRGQVSGRIERIDPDTQTLFVGPFAIRWSEQTRFEGMGADQLKPPATVRINVEMTESGAFHARSIEARSASFGPGMLQLTGLARQAEVRADGTVTMNLLNVPVHLDQAGYNRAKPLTRRQDAQRPDRQFQTPVFGRPLTLGGEYVATVRQRNNFDLDGRDDRIDLDHEFSLELFYPVDTRTALFAEVKGFYESELRDVTGTREHDRALARGQLWLYVGDSNVGLQIGRQNVAEVREWWWDEDIDAVRLYYDRGPWHIEAGLARELARESTLEDDINPVEKGALRFFGQVSWLWSPRQKLDVFWLHLNDRSATERVGQIVQEKREDPSDSTLTWLGLRALGELPLAGGGDLTYWMDAAMVRGRETVLGFAAVTPALSRVDSIRKQKVHGYAVDAGASWATRLPLRPTFTLAYAQGSGDANPDDGVDHAFRQSGLHENKWRFSGVNRFRYYGELLRPELSNLGISTFALGVPLLNNSSVEILYHGYRQIKVTDELRDVRIDAGLTGLSRDIGREVDVVFGFREWRHWGLEFIASAFKAGAAYGAAEGKRAYRLAFEATFNF